ncbi:hypothetical protein CHUAL_010190 [Chamberlinius hualienensis]
MIVDDYLIGDGSWELRIYVTDLKVERKLRVKGDLHIGGVMLKLVEDLDIAVDWSDHALWWPVKNMWLLRTRSTVDQYGVQADAILHFTPMHKILRVQMPDLQFRDYKVDFSVKVFNTIIKLCKEIGIRHPEELSFCRQLTQEQLKRNFKGSIDRRNRAQHDANNSSYTLSPDTTNLSINSLDRSSPNNTLHKPGTPVSNTGTWRAVNNYSPVNGSYNGGLSPSSMHSLSVDGLNGVHDTSLINSPQQISTDTKSAVIRPKTLVEKARMNAAWLDSSLSLMEQGVQEFDTILLRYKFYNFYDLNPKYDGIRINQIFEQAKWSLLTEELDCTEEEMMMFAALQLQVNLQSGLPQPNLDTTKDDDIDAALTDLQVTLEGSTISNNHNDITQIPELAGYLKFLKPKRFTLKGFKRQYFTFRDTRLSYYKGKEDLGSEPIQTIELKGCEVTPDVNISQGKYGIKLEVPSSAGMNEIWLRCESEDAYAKWMAACRLASKGKTMADSSYESEVASIQEFLVLQRPSPVTSMNISNLEVHVKPEDYVAPRFLKKIKGRQMCGCTCTCCPYPEKLITTRILEAHANVKDLNLLEAKMNYIKAWQALPDFGVTLFVVKFEGTKKEELLGVAFNRLMRMELNSGDHLKTWRYNTMKSWNVNWEVKHVVVQFEEDQNQTLNEELFHKLTGGWS